MEEQYLAIDLGSSNGKIISANLDENKKLTIHEMARFPTPRLWINGHLSIEIYAIYKEICKILSKFGIEGKKVKSLGVDSWSSDFAFVTEAGEIIGLPIFYRDKRTNGMTEEVEKIISYRELYALSTQRRMQDSTLCQLLAVKKENPRIFRQNIKMMHLGDVLMYLFTGKICSEISVASYSQMFNMKEKKWENQVFDMFEISRSIQSPIVHAGESLGRISEETSHMLGVNRFEVIAPAVHDTSSAGVAVPADLAEDWAYLSTGSWYLVSMEVEDVADIELSYRYNLSNTGLAFGKVLLKRNVCAMWIIQECKRIWEKKGIKMDYSMITTLADRAEPFVAMIDPDGEEFYNPEDMLEAIVQYLRKTGQKVPEKENIGQIARIVYESIIFKCRFSLEALKAASGREVHKLYVVGGASQVDFLNQMISSALNIMVLTGPQEAAAVGNILMQAIGTGELQSEKEVREVVQRNFKSKIFYPENTSSWDAHYSDFLSLCKLEKIKNFN